MLLRSKVSHLAFAVGFEDTSFDLRLILAWLLSGTEIGPCRIVHNAGAGNGWKAWRALADSYRPRSVVDGAEAMKRIQMTARCKDVAELRRKLEIWDS